MFKYLALERPLAVIDVETTGTNPQVDRIVEVSVLKIYPSGERKQKTRRINPLSSKPLVPKIAEN